MERGTPRIGFAPALLGLLVVSQLLFTIGLRNPAKPYFDEVYYVPAARALIGGLAYDNVEHPLVAKWLIGVGMRLFGDAPAGWRAIGTLMGAATVAAVALIAHSLFRDARTGLIAGFLTSIDQFVFVEARIATLDVYMGAFLLVALLLLIDSRARAGGRVRLSLAGAGALFGLAVGAKWAAAPYWLAACAAFALMKARAGPRDGKTLGAALIEGDFGPWRTVSAAEGVTWLGGLGCMTYFATFAPAFFVARDPLSLAALLPQQLHIYALQTQPLPPHPYMSAWWQWPLIGRPIWYLYEPVDGILRGVLLIGNPAIMWGGLVAVAVCLVGGIRARDNRLLLVAGLYLFSLALWAVIPKKIGFYYYYYPSAMFLSLAIAAAFHRFCGAGRLRALPATFLGFALGLFVYFYPVLSAAPLAQGEFNRWMWFDSWR